MKKLTQFRAMVLSENIENIKLRLNEKLVMFVCSDCLKILFEMSLPISIIENTRRFKEFKNWHGKVSKCCKAEIIFPSSKFREKSSERLISFYHS